MLKPLLRRVWSFRYSHHIGYRSTDLILFAFVWIVVGWDITRTGDPDPETTVPIEYLAQWVRVDIWYVCAAIAFVAAFWPKGRDQYGFAALIIPPLLRAISYWVAWAQGVVGYGGAVSLWPDALVWTVICIIVYRLARRPEIPHRPTGGEYGHHPGGEYGHPGLGRKRGEE